MCAAHRKSVRFDDIGKIEAPQICALPGVLDNISRDGCKVRFPFSVVVDLENEYELKVTPAQKAGENIHEPFTVLCRPRWVRDESGTTEIGFSILHSPEYNRVVSYIESLAEEENLAVENQIAGTVCRFA
ncbi:MAG: PilZ domain-containing protein [Treponema sp.]|nr:PilZ domain-containing protein [Treponema sp.]